ncbi:putative short-chain dehydrogenase [Colletotrichum plurivorum]|uniref:Putative short-chain dehydrogenase n=1 Tax=Colletotrichum plurivorum TaxID=2175906 RepID=A0A8H6NDA8_9PEZI|nr:putative short-chain dehydrogenase [Colletotrichum plurivorum]
MDAFHPYADLFANPQGPGDARPTAFQIIHDNDLVGKWSGKVVLITGGTSGLGLVSARALRLTGADVYITARDLAKAEAVIAEITSSVEGGGKLEAIEMDLDSLESVKQAAKDFLAKSPKLNVLINNAGIMAIPEPIKTKDGFDQQFGVNHLAHFTLAALLLPTLVASSTPSFNSRVVSLTSSGHRYSPVDLADPNFASRPYNPWVAYGQSKTANLWMTNQLDRLYGSKGVHAVSCQPGIVVTPLHKHVDAATGDAWRSDENVRNGIKTPEQGAATPVWAAVAPVWEGTGGKYLFDVAVGGPAKDPMSMADHGYGAHAFDEESERKLWELSLELTGVKIDV